MVAIKVDPVKGLRSLNLKLIASGTNKNVWGLNYKERWYQNTDSHTYYLA